MTSLAQMESLELLATVDQINSPNSSDRFSQPRVGVLWHFDDSSNDRSAVQWFRDPACTVSYNRLYLDNGDVVSVVPMTKRAYHAGASKVTALCQRAEMHGAIPVGGGNSAYYGLSASTDTHTPATERQVGAMLEDTARLFRFHGWGPDQVNARLLGHEATAIFTPKTNPGNPTLWGKLGRKIDPTGVHPDAPIVNLASARIKLALMLTGA